MPIQTVGDMSTQFQSLRQTGRIRSDLNRLSNELSTQQKSDLTAHLRGATGQVISLDREINLLESFSRTSTEVGQRLGYMQATLAVVDQMRGQFMSQALPITKDSTDAAIIDAAAAGSEVFSNTVTNLNKRFGDRALFSGAATDQNALADADVMLADIRLSVAGMTNVTDIKAALDTWFDDPAGGFATIGYLGDQGDKVEQNIGAATTVKIEARADDDAIRALLKGTALAAIADDAGLPLSMATRANLVAEAGQAMLGAADQLSAMRGTLGGAEARVEEASVSLATQLTAYRINRNDLTVADPFETASRLQDVQQQLEMHYAVTARLSQLSLVNYL